MMLMTILSPNARAVVQAGQKGLRPVAGDRERLQTLLEARLGPSTPHPSVDATRSVRVSGWRFVSSVALGVALVGGTALLALRAHTRTSVVPASTTAAPVASLASASVPATSEPLAEAREPVAPDRTPIAATSSTKTPLEPSALASRAQDPLAQEVTLLSRATSDLRAGRAADALKALDEHQRKFPNGVLSVERRAARAQALCSLKRVSEGRAELAQLAPQSPAAARAKQICDAAASASNLR
jgi:hypothetical protein